MIFGIKNAYERYLEAELERERNENRILLSALLERAISREAAMMLRKPGEVQLSLEALRGRAKAAYEARLPHTDPATDGQPVKLDRNRVDRMDLRNWRSARGGLEAVSAKEVAEANSNDSVERIEAKVKAAKGA